MSNRPYTTIDLACARRRAALQACEHVRRNYRRQMQVCQLCAGHPFGHFWSEPNVWDDSPRPAIYAFGVWFPGTALPDWAAREVERTGERPVRFPADPGLT